MSVSDIIVARQESQDAQHGRFDAEGGIRGFYLAKVKLGD